MKRIIKECLDAALIESKSFLIYIPSNLLEDKFILTGDQSSLESIEIVNILILLEEILNSKLGKKIDCFDLLFTESFASLTSIEAVDIIHNYLERCT